MATKNAIIKGVSAGETSVTFETTKLWAETAELNLPIRVIKDDEFYKIVPDANGKKSYLAFIADLKGSFSSVYYKEPSLKCLRLYLNDGTLLRCVKATRIEDINANNKHKYFVNLDKGNVTQDLFSYFELIFSTIDPLKTGQYNVAALYNANVTFDENIHYKIGFICPTSYYAGYEIAPFIKNGIWYYPKDFKVSLLEHYLIFKDSSLTAEDISKIGMANHSYTDTATAYGNIYFNYLLLKKFNYRSIELSKIEIDETNFDGKKTYYIDLFLKDSTFKMLDYMTEFFQNTPRYDEDIIITVSDDELLDDYNKIHPQLHIDTHLNLVENPAEDKIEQVPLSKNPSGMDYYALRFDGSDRNPAYNGNICMVSFCNFRIYLKNGEILYPVGIRTLNAEISRDEMPTENKDNWDTYNLYSEFEVVYSKKEPVGGYVRGYPNPSPSINNNGVTVDDNADYVKVRVIINQLYAGYLALEKYTDWNVNRYTNNNQYNGLKNYGGKNQFIQLVILFDNDSKITPDDINQMSINNSLEAGTYQYTGNGYTYGFHNIWIARCSSNNAKKFYRMIEVKDDYKTRTFTFFANMNDNGTKLRFAENRFKDTDNLINGHQILPERYQ